MSKLDELIKELCPNGVEYKYLGEIGQVKMCKRILKSQTNANVGIPFYKIGTFGRKASAFISEELFKEYFGGNRAIKKQDVIEKLKAFFRKYYGISSSFVVDEATSSKYTDNIYENPLEKIADTPKHYGEKDI